MGAFLPHFLLLLNKIRSNLLIFEGFGVGGGEMHIFRAFSASHSFCIKLTDWHGADLLCNLDKNGLEHRGNTKAIDRDTAEL